MGFTILLSYVEFAGCRCRIPIHCSPTSWTGSSLTRRWMPRAWNLHASPRHMYIQPARAGSQSWSEPDKAWKPKNKRPLAYIHCQLECLWTSCWLSNWCACLIAFALAYIHCISFTYFDHAQKIIVWCDIIQEFPHATRGALSAVHWVIAS